MGVQFLRNLVLLLSTPKYNLKSQKLIQIATQNHPLTPQIKPPDLSQSSQMHPKTSPGAPRTSFGKHWRYKDHKKTPKSAPETPRKPQTPPKTLPKFTGNDSKIEQKTRPKKNNVFGDVFVLIRDAQNVKYIAPVEAKR